MFAVLLIAAAAAWSPPVRRLDDRVTMRSAVAIPFVFALVAVVLAGYAALTPKNNLFGVALTMLTLLAVVVRLAFTVRAHLAMIEATERDALTDALTRTRQPAQATPATPTSCSTRPPTSAPCCSECSTSTV